MLLAQQAQLLQSNNNQNNQTNQKDTLNEQGVLHSVKTDSQLRKMLQQTKHNIINSLHSKKNKNLGFKFNKSNNSSKTNKRKLMGIQNGEQLEKVLALSEDNLPTAMSPNEIDTFDGIGPSEHLLSNADLKLTKLLQTPPQTVTVSFQNFMDTSINK